MPIAGIIFHGFDVIVLLGILQATVMAALLWMSGPANRSLNLFACILLTLAGLSAKILLHTTGAWDLAPFRYFPLAIDTLLPPLLYTYLLSVTGVLVSRRRLFLYLSPTVLLMVHAIVVYLLALSQPNLLLKDRIAASLFYNQVKNAEDLMTGVSAIICWWAGYRRHRTYRDWLYRSQSDTRLEEYGWLKNLLIVSGILALIFLLITIMEDILKAGHHDFILLEIFYVYLMVISYYLSLKGYSLYVIKASYQIPGPEQEQAEDIAPAQLTGDQLAVKQKIITGLEKDRLYLDPELGLKDLAAHIGCPAGIVSAVINQGFDQNFRNLVNGYRVGAVREMLKAPPAHLSLLGIALECGFNSEASFYRIFRQVTGMSPNDYLQKINAQNRF